MSVLHRDFSPSIYPLIRKFISNIGASIRISIWYSIKLARIWVCLTWIHFGVHSSLKIVVVYLIVRNWSHLYSIKWKVSYAADNQEVYYYKMTNDLNRLFLYIYLIGTPTLMIATKISEKYSPSFLKLSNRLLFLFHFHLNEFCADFFFLLLWWR